MDKDKTELDAFLGDLSNTSSEELKQSEDVFDTKEETVEEPEIEKPLPFNKDPKIQKYLEKREREMEERLKASIPTTREIQNEEDSFKDVIDSFTTVIGNDTPEKVSALNALKKSLSSLDQRASQKAIEQLESIRNEEVEADREAEDELENAFDNIEETFDVDITSNNPIAKKTRQEFVSFVEKIAPKDRNGDIVDYPDMNSAWETFSDIKKSTAQPNRAKDLASRGMRNSAETTSGEIKGRTTFAEAERFIENLK
jgi:hypothetical protein